MTKLLHIETSTKVCSVALSTHGELVDLKEKNSDKYIHGELLTVFIEEILERNKWQLQDLHGIVITSGPGSYTGLRIGVSTAKGLCYALRIPLIAVDALYSIAYLASQKYKSTNICAMIDARRMEVFSTVYNSELEVLKPLSADILNESSYEAFLPFIICGDGANKVKDLWKGRDIIIDCGLLSSAAGQVEWAYQKFLNEDFEDVAYFEPKYLKDFIVTPPKNKGL